MIHGSEQFKSHSEVFTAKLDCAVVRCVLKCKSQDYQYSDFMKINVIPLNRNGTYLCPGP
jgi:hypothetical protein